MDYHILPECSCDASGSHDSLLPGKQCLAGDATVFHPKRTLKLSDEAFCLRKTSSLSDVNELQKTLHSRFCQRLTSSQMACGPRLRSSQHEEIFPLPAEIPRKELMVCDSAASTEKSQSIKDNNPSPEKELCIGSLGIINSLKVIISGKGVWEKIVHSFIRCCSDTDQWTTDEEWLDYLSKKIQAVDNNPAKYWKRCPREMRILIQEIIFVTLKTIHRYSMADEKNKELDRLNSAIQSVLQQYYRRFGEALFWLILDPDTYTKRTWFDPSQGYDILSYNFNVIPVTLKKLLAPSAAELACLPVLRKLKNDITVTEAALGFDPKVIQEMAEKRYERIERQRLFKLFTHRPLDAYLSPVVSMEGFTNFSNTCFAAVSTWQILVSPYIHLLSATSHPPTIECDPEGEQDHDERYISRTSGEKVIPLKNLSPEVCLTLLKKELDIYTKTRLSIDAIRKCLITMERQYRKKQHPEMQKTYELFLTLCSVCASDHIFVGFEGFHERYIKFINSQLLKKQAAGTGTEKNTVVEGVGQENGLPLLPLNQLPQQDSAEFLSPLLKLVIPREQLNKCAFRLLTERRIMRGSDIVMITDDPRPTMGNIPGVSPINDTVQSDTLIYSVPVSVEQAGRDDFSIQMILDDALSLKNIPEGEHQKITIDSNNFRHAINNLPTPLSRAKETGTGDHLWDVLQERQVLLVEDAPEVITIQLKILPEPFDRAKVAEKLARDTAQEFQLTCRKASPDAILPPEEIIQRYRIATKVFYVEDRGAGTRHYRCLINGRDRLPDHDEQEVIDKVVVDDRRVFVAPSNQKHLHELGILCMFTAEKVTAPAPYMEKVDVTEAVRE